MNQYNNQMVLCAEAAQEAEAREFRQMIDFRSKWHKKEVDVAQRQAMHEKEEWDRRKKRRECENRKAENIRTFIWRNFWCVLLFAVTGILDLFSLIDYWVCLGSVVLIGTYLTLNFMAYVTRNLVIFEDLE